MEPNTILVVLPHPDDEGIIAGTLIQYAKQGAEITYICLTLGEMGRNLGMPPFANRVTLPEIRRQELHACCQIIGIQQVESWGLMDKTVEFEDQELWIQRIMDKMKELKPSLVLTFYPGHGVHPDHDAAGRMAIEAMRRLSPEERPVVHGIAMTAHAKDLLGPADVVHDVTAYVEQKIRAIQAHKSQFQLLIGNGSFEDPKRLAHYRTERLWTYRFDD